MGVLRNWQEWPGPRMTFPSRCLLQQSPHKLQPQRRRADSSPYIMEKLPVHAGNSHQRSGSGWTTSHSRRGPSRMTYLRRIIIALFFFIGCCMLMRRTSTGMTDSLNQTPDENSKPIETHHSPPGIVEPARTNIPLEVHIMSKCPDAQECLQDLIVPAMEKISDKVDFKLSFIAE